MAYESHDLTKGSIWGQVMRFSVPLALSNLLQVLFNMSDIAVVGRFAGDSALGAVGSTSQLVLLFTGFLMGMGSGVNVVAATYFGARDGKNLHDAIHCAVAVLIITGVVLLTVGEMFTRPLLELLNTKSTLIDGAELYLRIYFIGMPALAVYNFGNGVLSAIGNTKTPLIFLTVAGVINVCLNIFFVLVLGMDVDGVAIASVISQYLSAILIIVYLVRTKDCYGLSLGKIKLNKFHAKRLLSLGIPAGCQHAIFCIANMFIQAGVNSFDEVVVEGNSAAANADGLVYSTMDAFYIACTSFVGQNYGAGNRERIKKSYFVTTVYAFVISAVLAGFLILFGSEFLNLFTKSEDVVSAGMERLLVLGISYPFSAFMDNSISASRGIGKTIVPTIVVILGSCVFRVIWVYTIFAYFHTITALYLLYIFSWAITGTAEVIYFFREFKKDPRLYPAKEK